jgi:cycloeucalenol cycloisomerase
MSFAANYFWTHYFYPVLGASYTFVAWRVNDVPVCLFLMTHSYFMFYHTVRYACV